MPQRATSGMQVHRSIVIGFDDTTEPSDFNLNGDGEAPWTLLELAKARGMKVGVVSTAQITHATPAATYAHINQRNNENDIALQALPSDSTYNQRLGSDVFNIAGYPLRPLQELPYPVQSYEPGYAATASHGFGILDLVYDLDQSTGHVSETTDQNGVPYTVLGYDVVDLADWLDRH
jgi:hypothetical protein